MPNIILIHNEYPDSGALLRVLNYALRSDVLGGYAIDPTCAYGQMMMIKKAYHKTEGTQLLHFIISFSTQEAYRITIDEMLDVGFRVAQQLGSFQTAYGLHSDTYHFHLHMVTNTVSFETGLRYSDGRAAFWRIRNVLQEEFPQSDVGIYQSFPLSDYNRYLEADRSNQFLRIG